MESYQSRYVPVVFVLGANNAFEAAIELLQCIV